MSLITKLTGSRYQLKNRTKGLFVYSPMGIAIGSDDILRIIGNLMAQDDKGKPKPKYVVEIERSKLRLVMDPESMDTEFVEIPFAVLKEVAHG